MQAKIGIPGWRGRSLYQIRMTVGRRENRCIEYKRYWCLGWDASSSSSCHGGWEFYTVYRDMPNKSCLVMIARASHGASASSNFRAWVKFKFASNLLLVFDTAMSQDIPSRPRLYLIQRASQDISLQDLACISTTYHLSAHSPSLSTFFFFSYLP